MKKDVKEKWVAALRSGEYEQGRKRLRTLNNKFCCLGVLVDITHPEWWKIANPSDWVYSVFTGDDRGPYTALPPFDLEKELDIPSGLPKHSGEEPFLYLANLNDDGKTFAEIADFIEENL